jgi:hypothetical protein
MTTLSPEIEFDDTLDRKGDEERQIREWRVDQLRRLGVPVFLAEVIAGNVDWHDVATLIGRGCPPLLAVEIAR